VCSSDLGIVYATDAKLSKKVEIVAAFPDETHSPIVYPGALVTQSGDAQAFLNFLTNPSALGIFAGYGFKPITGKP
jgi:molybdate transport system substrate-binding protein